jgi:hypothetical protein
VVNSSASNSSVSTPGNGVGVGVCKKGFFNVEEMAGACLPWLLVLLLCIGCPKHDATLQKSAQSTCAVQICGLQNTTHEIKNEGERGVQTTADA